jgi:hypothetical protein
MSRFFNKLFYISLILILLGSMSSTITCPSKVGQYWVGIFSGALANVGLAVFVANIFSFIIGTTDFLNYIRDRLVEIVLSKDFVTRLGEDEQKKLLKLTMKPPREISSIYSGIDDFFDGYVNQSMALFDTCYRGQMYISAEASIDKEKNVLRIDWDVNYIVYRIAEKFEPLPFWLGDEKSVHVDTTITADKSEIETLTNADIQETAINDPSMAKGYTMDVPEKFNKYREINIRRRVTEFGSDHWQLFCYKALKPCHRMQIELRCKDGIEIRETNIFGAQEDFQISEDKDKVRVSYNHWLSPGYGVTVLVGLNGAHD